MTALKNKDLCGVIDLFLSKWGCVFRQLRGCTSDIKKQLRKFHKLIAWKK